MKSWKHDSPRLSDSTPNLLADFTCFFSSFGDKNVFKILSYPLSPTNLSFYKDSLANKFSLRTFHVSSGD